MTFTNIQLKKERVLFAIAAIFSTMVWIGILGSAMRIATLKAPQPELCFWYNDEEKLVYNTMDKIEDKTICLSRTLINDDTYEKTMAKEMASTEVIAKISGLGALFTVGFYAVCIVAFLYFTTALAMAYIRLNGVRLSKKQYPEFFAVFEKTGAALGLTKLPRAYIIDEGGIANAFAIKIASRRMVVFYAELVNRMLDQGKFDELQAIAGHELTHVKLRHINWWLFLLPSQFLPYLGRALSRARELSADRGALFVVKNPETVAMALLKIVAGKKVAREVDMDEYVENGVNEYGFFVFLSKLYATHPPMPFRIQALREASKE